MVPVARQISQHSRVYHRHVLLRERAVVILDGARQTVVLQVVFLVCTY